MRSISLGHLGHPQAVQVAQGQRTAVRRPQPGQHRSGHGHVQPGVPGVVHRLAAAGPPGASLRSSRPDPTPVVDQLVAGHPHQPGGGQLGHGLALTASTAARKVSAVRSSATASARHSATPGSRRPRAGPGRRARAGPVPGRLRLAGAHPRPHHRRDAARLRRPVPSRAGCPPEGICAGQPVHRSRKSLPALRTGHKTGQTGAVPRRRVLRGALWGLSLGSALILVGCSTCRHRRPRPPTTVPVPVGHARVEPRCRAPPPSRSTRRSRWPSPTGRSRPSAWPRRPALVKGVRRAAAPPAGRAPCPLRPTTTYLIARRPGRQHRSGQHQAVAVHHRRARHGLPSHALPR